MEDESNNKGRPTASAPKRGRRLLGVRGLFSCCTPIRPVKVGTIVAPRRFSTLDHDVKPAEASKPRSALFRRESSKIKREDSDGPGFLASGLDVNSNIPSQNSFNIQTALYRQSLAKVLSKAFTKNSAHSRAKHSIWLSDSRGTMSPEPSAIRFGVSGWSDPLTILRSFGRPLSWGKPGEEVGRAKPKRKPIALAYGNT
eukprot:1194457-Prorocentrum_minimum.AAC.1